MKAKTILITGSNGLLGQKLVEQLRGRTDVRLIATSKGENRHPVQDGYTYASLDITDEERMRALFDQYQPTEMINGAAMTHVDKCEENQDLCWKLNVEAVEIMTRVCQDHGTRLVHLSTDFIFDGEDGPYQEEDRPNPLSYYGESKLASEKLVLESGINAAIVRTMLVYGVIGDGSRSNIVLWARKALRNQNPINVVNDQFRSPTLAEDLAAGCIEVAMRDASGIFHISGPETLSVVEMVYAVADHWGLDKGLVTEVSSDTLAQAAKRPPRTGFNIEKARTSLDYQPKSFQEGLAVVAGQLDQLGL